MHTLVLNIGNTTLFGGAGVDDQIVVRFRVPVREAATRAGFRRHVGRLVRGPIDRAALCSVVPALTPKVAGLVERAFGLVPRVLTSLSPHGLRLGYRHPRELGSDRLAAAMGARRRFPRENVVIVDCGTATTVTALTRDGTLAGGAILPGIALTARMLAMHTAQLPLVDPVVPRRALGRSPREGIASGVHFGHVGALRELIGRIAREAFGRRRFSVVGTGGQAERFRDENLFAQWEPDLILEGLLAFAHV